MSIQAECRAAMNRLADQGRVFTEIDVANEARSSGWSSTNLERALKDAYNVLAGDYKKGRLVRYGPVTFKGHQDYARRATKIVYADADKGPRTFDTPNGSFARLFSADDTLARAGRKVGTDRDDTKPWSVQSPVRKVAEAKGPPIDPAPFMKRIQELEAERNRLEKELQGCRNNGNGHWAAKEEPTEPEQENVQEFAERVAEIVMERFAEKLIA